MRKKFSLLFLFFFPLSVFFFILKGEKVQAQIDIVAQLSKVLISPLKYKSDLSFPDSMPFHIKWFRTDTGVTLDSKIQIYLLRVILS